MLSECCSLDVPSVIHFHGCLKRWSLGAFVAVVFFVIKLWKIFMENIRMWGFQCICPSEKKKKKDPSAIKTSRLKKNLFHQEPPPWFFNFHSGPSHQGHSEIFFFSISLLFINF